MRRAAASIPANLAEGCGRNSEYHLLLAKDLNLISAKDHRTLADRVSELKRMLAALRRKLKADS
jgi:four helix bundle protein